MAQPKTVTVNGAVIVGPASSTSLVPSLQDNVLLSVLRTYAYSTADTYSINNPVEGSPFTLPLGSITKVRFFYMRVIGASAELMVTNAHGADQKFDVSEMIVWSSPNEGTQLTAIKLVGVTDIEVILSGD